MGLEEILDLMEEVGFFRGKNIPQRQNQIAKPVSAKAFEVLQNIITC